CSYLSTLLSVFLLSLAPAHRDLHSFPTRRSSDLTFTFPIFGTARYQITATAEGYNPRTAIVDPKDIDANGKVVRDIALTPKGERSEEHTSELQSRENLVCRLLLEKKKKNNKYETE